jgi:hypothetical protein
MAARADDRDIHGLADLFCLLGGCGNDVAGFF